MNRILAPITQGSGVAVLHGTLARQIEGYHVVHVDPRRALLPQSLSIPEGDWQIAHSLPDLGGYGIPQRIPLLLTFHGFYFDADALRHATPLQRLFYSGPLKRLVRRAVKRSSQIIAVSPHIADMVTEHLGVRPEVIFNGVDTERFVPSPARDHEGKLRVLFCGNLRSQKGVDIITSLAWEMADCCEFIVAAGLRLDRRARRMPGVTFLGCVPPDHMPSVYAGADVLCLPTLREGMSLVTLEAMSSGLPVVTTDIPAQSYLIDDGQGGFTLPIKDRSGFAKGLRRLAGDRQLRLALGTYNRTKVLKSFRQEQMFSAYREMFRRLSA